MLHSQPMSFCCELFKKPLPRCPPHLFAPYCIRKQRSDSFGAGTAVLHLDQNSIVAVFNNIRNTTPMRGDDRQAEAHCLKQHDRKCLRMKEGGKAEDICAFVSIPLRIACKNAGKFDTVFTAGLAEYLVRALLQLRAVPFPH